jgi:hypothetical protein
MSIDTPSPRCHPRGAMHRRQVEKEMTDVRMSRVRRGERAVCLGRRAGRRDSRQFGERPVGELRSEEIATWRIALTPGYRFDATQALRQVLARAVVWGMIDVNPAKLGVDNPSPRRREQRPFESWAELDRVAAKLSPRRVHGVQAGGRRQSGSSSRACSSVK